MSKNVLIDTDGTIEDFSALLQLFRNSSLNIVGICVCGGRVDVDVATDNVIRFLEYITILNIPVHRGFSSNVSDRHIGDYFYGDNGLCDINVPKTNFLHESKQTAVEAYLNYIEKYPNNLTLLVLGPCTNIMKAYEKDPTIEKKFRDIFMVLGNSTEFAEFNAYADPAAFKLVLQNFVPSSGFQIQLIDLSFQKLNLIETSIPHEILYANENDLSLNPKKSYFFAVYNSKLFSLLNENGYFGIMKLSAAFSLTSRKSVDFSIKQRLINVVESGEKIGMTEFEINRSETVEIIQSLEKLDLWNAIVNSFSMF